MYLTMDLSVKHTADVFRSLHASIGNLMGAISSSTAAWYMYIHFLPTCIPYTNIEQVQARVDASGVRVGAVITEH